MEVCHAAFQNSLTLATLNGGAGRAAGVQPWGGSVTAAVLSLAGLGQVLEFMYTAKLSLSPENVDDVLAVASFLQMQDVITACHALKSLAEPATSAGGNPEALPVEGQSVGSLSGNRQPETLILSGGLPLTLGHLPGSLHLPCFCCGELVSVGCSFV